MVVAASTGTARLNHILANTGCLHVLNTEAAAWLAYTTNQSNPSRSVHVLSLDRTRCVAYVSMAVRFVQTAGASHSITQKLGIVEGQQMEQIIFVASVVGDSNEKVGHHRPWLPQYQPMRSTCTHVQRCAPGGRCVWCVQSSKGFFGKEAHA